jgi:predicted metal-dependent HD superfamily phosphohydrolase
VDRDGLSRRWHELLDPFHAPPALVDASFDDISSRYGEPRRHYHTLDHIQRVLASIDELRPSAHDPMALELAAWLHDVVYDPRAGDNEVRSAALARDLLSGLGSPASTADRVADLILTTVDHRPASGDGDAAILLDADLAVLGAEPEAYDDYCLAIREEFSWLPDAEYRAGRSALLRRFLERGDIFHTPPMRDALEARARANLEGELVELTAGRGI